MKRRRRLHVSDVGLFDPHPLAGRSLRPITQALIRLRPRASFRIYCDRQKRGKFYQVVILRRIRQLPRAARTITGVERGWSRARGFCHSLDVLTRTRRGWHPNRLAGFVVLAVNQLASGYVAHELTHAAHFRLCRAGGARRPLEHVEFGDRRLQEPLAEMVGLLTAQFWVAFYRKFPTATAGLVRRGRV